MNSDKLLKDLYDTIKESGWLDKATEYFREHPEKFNDCVNSDGKIAGIHMSISYQPESLSAVKDTKPNVFISIGTERDFNVYCSGRIQSRTWSDNNLVTEVSSHV